MRKTDKYILKVKNGKPIPVYGLLKWAQWFETSKEMRIVEQTYIRKIIISTVFLSLDHSFFGKGKPILYETMVFGSKRKLLNGYQVRYTSVALAKKGHKDTVAFVKEIYKKK